jgi:tetratricopeptide (TPR) repeat protein
MVAPVAGALSLGYHLTADRYTYVPCLGFAVLAGGGVAVLLDASVRRPERRVLGPATRVAIVLATVCLGVLTWHQAQAWRDSTSLWRQAVRATPDCVVCRVNLGHELLEASAPGPALEQFARARELQPDRAQTYRSLGLALEGLGRRDAAIDAYRAGLALTPPSLTLRLSLASALLAAGRLEETVGVVDEAGRFYAPNTLASYYGAAAQHRPEAPVPRLGLVRAWTALGDRDRARGELESLRRLAPGLADLAAARGGL